MMMGKPVAGYPLGKRLGLGLGFVTFGHSRCCIRSQARAHQLVTTTLHSCSPEDSMDSALELMNRIKRRRAPLPTMAVPMTMVGAPLTAAPLPT